MKVYIYKTSDRTATKGIKREFLSLEDCVKTLMAETGEREYIISDIKQYYGFEDASDCSWLVEVYDDYRE